MSKELSQQYHSIFQALVSGKEVDITIFNAKMLNRIRSALNVIKANWDETQDMFGLGKSTAEFDISIKRKNPENQYLYVISFVKKEETSFVILDIK